MVATRGGRRVALLVVGKAVVMRRVLMMMRMAAAMVAVGGCSVAMRPVRLRATPAVRETLAGEWRGDYRMTGHDRHGIIAFRLKALEQEATGDVLMISDRFAWPYSAFPSKGKPPRREYDTESQLLSIRFVSADRDRIRGTMDPYWDPDRDCLASTSFLGSVDGDVIRGTFSSVCEDGIRTLGGRWRVERRRPSTRR
jgi:hypothetical protein